MHEVVNTPISPKEKGVSVMRQPLPTFQPMMPLRICLDVNSDDVETGMSFVICDGVVGRKAVASSAGKKSRRGLAYHVTCVPHPYLLRRRTFELMNGATAVFTPAHVLTVGTSVASTSVLSAEIGGKCDSSFRNPRVDNRSTSE